MKFFRVVHFVWFSLMVTSVTGYAEDSIMAFQKWQELQLTQTAVADTPNRELVATVQQLREALASSSPRDVSAFQTDRGGSRSANSSDLQPFVNTKWQFSTTIINTFIDTISCGNHAWTTDSGDFVLDCANELGDPAGVVYVTNDRKYLMVVNDTLGSVFVFTLQDGCCNGGGVWFGKALDPDLKNPYSLTVTKMEEIDVPPTEPGLGEVPIDYYKNPNTGDVWGDYQAARLTPSGGQLPGDMWRYGLRAIFLAKYACWDASVREWMPNNIANAVYYCTNPADAKQMAAYLRELADKLDPPK